MNRPITVCDRCGEKYSCLLDFDSVSCRETRTVEPTNADKLRSMDDEELGRFLANIRNEITCVISGIYGCEEDSCDKCWIKWLEEVSE